MLLPFPKETEVYGRRISRKKKRNGERKRGRPLS